MQLMIQVHILRRHLRVPDGALPGSEDTVTEPELGTRRNGCLVANEADGLHLCVYCTFRASSFTWSCV